MRISAHEGAPGFVGHEKIGRFRIFLDGFDVSDVCYAADDERGIVFAYDRNENGEKYIDPNTGEVARVVMHGQVEIVELMNGCSG